MGEAVCRQGSHAVHQVRDGLGKRDDLGRLPCDLCDHRSVLVDGDEMVVRRRVVAWHVREGGWLPRFVLLAAWPTGG